MHQLLKSSGSTSDTVWSHVANARSARSSFQADRALIRSGNTANEITQCSALIVHLANDDSGATAIEYGLIAAGISRPPKRRHKENDVLFCIKTSRLKKPHTRGPGADSEEKHEPVSDIDAVAVDSLKRLTPIGRLEKRTSAMLALPYHL